ncbi:trypsin-like peptidase domain-containing protein [Polyangium aurulentum]|uniref:trypsin-like peptidase domain-containing protein n=1 Tax=Polyangium aurulentum TaxID=2567896 RepID=UPI0010AED2FD|nr:trypsin-like peptidase domain-containing protein [Polyangium aurulentum]UQA57428.1 trypsin-like peptidase domain-containing protein [Polyangium aurulentum]
MPRVHFLDEVDYDWSRPEAVEFYDIMIRAYGRGQSADLLLAKSGVDRASIDFKQPPRDFWKQALEVAAMAGRTRAVAQSARNDPSIAAYHPKLDRLMGASPAPVEAPAPAQPIEWNGNELITGKQATFLEMSFFHQGLRIAASVVRLTTLTQGDRSYHGTGFLIAPDTILTNHHVLHDRDGHPVKQVDIWFNFELDAEGRTRSVDNYEGDASTIVGEAKHDWAVIRSKKPFNRIYPVLDLRPSKPVARGDFVYIVQHPAGQTKKIGLVHNEIVHVTEDRVQYLTDTLPGSSGSPVCNELWQVVALHKRGIEGDEANGHICKNEGIHIDRVVERLTVRGILKPVA